MGNGRVVDVHSGRKPHERLLDQGIAALAGCQHGVVGRAQPPAMGFTAAAIDFRLRRCRLHVVFRGVYSPSPIVSGMGRWMAATLAVGPDSVLSHASAGPLSAMRASSSPVVDLTVPRARVARCSTWPGCSPSPPSSRHSREPKALLLRYPRRPGIANLRRLERDRDRHRRALVAWNTIRVTWRMLDDHPGELERDLTRLPSARGPQPLAA